MALSLRCPCGAEFEVEDTFAGQAVGCPDCGAALKAPPTRRRAARTSGYALASVVLALVGAFTLVGTVLATLLGVMGLVSVARHRGRVTGAGFAVFGILMGVTFTALTGFAVVNAEVFDRVRETVNAHEADRGGPLEVVRKDEGYAITRPSRPWGVATPATAKEMQVGGNLLLVNTGKDAYIEVVADDAGRQSLDQYRESFLDTYRKDAAPGKARNLDDLMRFTQFKLRETKRLAPKDGVEATEVLFDVKLAGQNLAYRARLVKPKGGTEAYAVIAWAHRRRLAQLQDEVTRAMDSFRVLPG